MITTPTYKWNSVHRPIYFGIDYNETYAWAYTSVTNVNGKARFNFSIINPYGTPPCKFMYIISGIYQGFHAVTRIDAVGNIYTNTDFIGTASGTNARLLVNLNYELYTGYPSVSYYTTINPYWKNDGTLHINLSPFIHSTFKSPIQAPVVGVDTNMFTHFRVKIVPGKDFREHLLLYSLNPQLFTDTMTGWVWNAANNKWYALNASITHVELQQYVGGLTHLHIVPPPIHDGMILSKIVWDKVENIVV